MGTVTQERKTYYTLVTAGKILSHLQATCRGLHAPDVLALKNEMQHYHIDSEGFPEYINEIEDAQEKAERANNPINATTLIIIATKMMISTEKFPQSNEDWEELDVSQRTWARCKRPIVQRQKRQG